MDSEKNFEVMLGGATKYVGQTIRDVVKAVNKEKTPKISIENLGVALIQSMKNHDFFYEEDTIHGYLYNKTWPQMTKETAIDIISEAFESVLQKLGRESEVEGAKKTISEKINEKYSEYEREMLKDVVARTIARHLFSSHYKDAALFVSRNIAACSSLSAEDIEFWDSISLCATEQKKELFKKWSGGTIQIQTEILFKTVTSPAFCQWVTIRDKDYSDSARKERKEQQYKLPQAMEKQLRKMTQAQTNSLLAVAGRLEASTDKKHPLCPPEEIDLLLLFKYFSTDTRRAALLEEVKRT